MKKLALHWQIMLGMIAGLIFGLLITKVPGGKEFVGDWIKPIGSIFISLLKLIAIPLIIASLIKGISDLKDISKFSSIGLRTIALYIMSTFMAVTIGLTLVNIVQPGKHISTETLEQLSQAYVGDAEKKVSVAEAQKTKGPLKFIEDMVPQNIFQAASSNKNMLQVIFFTIFFGIALLLVEDSKKQVIKSFFDGLNEVCLLYTSPSPRDQRGSRMPSSA